MNGINKQPLYIKGDYALIARYNKFDEVVEIADINEPQEINNHGVWYISDRH